MIERRGQTVEIAARLCARALNLLKRRVVWRVAENAARRGDTGDLPGKAFGKSEVEQDDLPFIGELQILWLDVSMNGGRVLVVQIDERVQQLVRPD